MVKRRKPLTFRIYSSRRCKGFRLWAVKAREYGIINHDVDSFAPRAFFSTLTNVNFDSPRIVGYAREAIALREALKAQCGCRCQRPRR